MIMIIFHTIRIAPPATAVIPPVFKFPAPINARNIILLKTKVPKKIRILSLILTDVYLERWLNEIKHS